MTEPKTPYDFTDADKKLGSMAYRSKRGSRYGYLRALSDLGAPVRALVGEITNIMQIVDGDNDPDAECSWCGEVVRDGHAVADDSCPVPFLRTALAAVETLFPEPTK